MAGRRTCPRAGRGRPGRSRCLPRQRARGSRVPPGRGPPALAGEHRLDGRGKSCRSVALDHVRGELLEKSGFPRRPRRSCASGGIRLAKALDECEPPRRRAARGAGSRCRPNRAGARANRGGSARGRGSVPRAGAGAGTRRSRARPVDPSGRLRGRGRRSLARNVLEEPREGPSGLGGLAPFHRLGRRRPRCLTRRGPSSRRPRTGRTGPPASQSPARGGSRAPPRVVSSRRRDPRSR